ncbi:MAG: polysaccharide deacetylase [Candidatus Angelobacter sp.]|nr:polysaccharide deacetylase [Candidatus Angelobacter sp.]
MLERWFTGKGVTLNGNYIPLDGPNRREGIQELTSRLLALEPHPRAMYAAIRGQLPSVDSFQPADGAADEFAGMTVEQIQEIGNDPLFTIGAHTVDHPYLTRCDPEEAECQILENKLWLERITGKTCDFFAYPIGDFGGTTITLCIRAGFKKAFSVVRKSESHPQFAVRRIGVYSPSLLPLAAKLFCGNWFPSRLIQALRASKSPVDLAPEAGSQWSQDACPEKLKMPKKDLRHDNRRSETSTLP